MQKNKLNIFPEMQKEDRDRLRADLLSNGYDATQPIYTYHGEILDGWNRFTVCNELGITPVIKCFTGSDSEALDFVMRTNKRRNLTSSQWACIAAEADDLINAISEAVEEARLKKQIANATNQHSVPCVNKLTQPEPVKPPERVTTKVAETFNTNRTYVTEAVKLKAKDPVKFEQVKSGVKTFTEVKRDEKKQIQSEKFKVLRKKEVELITNEYDVIVIDPPWQMEKIKRDVAPLQVGFDYPTMTIEQIKQIKLPAAKDCHLFMWITHKQLPFGFEILKEWNAKYVCVFVWHKNGGFQPFGLPQYNCEFVLYARIGTPVFCDLKQFNTCFSANRTGHSKKPDSFYEMIKRVTAGKRIDIFNRRDIEGFDKWGNESK